MTSLVDAQQQEAAGGKKQEDPTHLTGDLNGLQDKLSTLLQGDNEVGVYVMPGIEDFEFDSDNEALDPDQEGDEDAVMDMDGFFADIDLKQGLQRA